MRKLNSFWNICIDWLLFSILYLMLALIGLESRDPWSLSSIIWLPSGILLGVLCTKSQVCWPFYITSAGVINMLINSFIGLSIDISLTLFFAQFATALSVAMMWRKFSVHFIDSLDKKRMLLALFFVYVVSIIGGILSIASLKLLGYPVELSKFYIWSLSNVLGYLSLAPVLVFQHIMKKVPLSFSFKYVLLILPCSVFMLPPYFFEHMLLQQAVLYFIMAGALILAIEFSLCTLVLYLFCLVILANLSTLHGYGPFVVFGSKELQFLQIYLLAVASISLLLASHNKNNIVKSDVLKFNLLHHLLKNRQPIFFQLSENLHDIRWLNTESIFSMSANQLPTVLHFQARIHPDDRNKFSHCLSGLHIDSSRFSQCSLRLLLTDHHYHYVRCGLVHKHFSPGFLGLLISSDESHCVQEA